MSVESIFNTIFGWNSNLESKIDDHNIKENNIIFVESDIEPIINKSTNIIEHIKSPKFNLSNQPITGKQFNNINATNNRHYICLIKNKCAHNSSKYNEGLNIATNLIEGLYFCDKATMQYWTRDFESFDLVWTVTIPDDATIIVYEKKIKTDRFILSNRHTIIEELYEIYHNVVENINENIDIKINTIVSLFSFLSNSVRWKQYWINNDTVNRLLKMTVNLLIKEFINENENENGSENDNENEEYICNRLVNYLVESTFLNNNEENIIIYIVMLTFEFPQRKQMIKSLIVETVRKNICKLIFPKQNSSYFTSEMCARIVKVNFSAFMQIIRQNNSDQCKPNYICLLKCAEYINLLNYPHDSNFLNSAFSFIESDNCIKNIIFMHDVPSYFKPLLN